MHLKWFVTQCMVDIDANKSVFEQVMTNVIDTLKYISV